MYAVDLVPVGQNSISGGGQHTLTFQRGETRVEPGAGSTGETLHRIEILVQVS